MKLVVKLDNEEKLTMNLAGIAFNAMMLANSVNDHEQYGIEKGEWQDHCRYLLTDVCRFGGEEMIQAYMNLIYEICHNNYEVGETIVIKYAFSQLFHIL